MDGVHDALNHKAQTALEVGASLAIGAGLALLLKSPSRAAEVAGKVGLGVGLAAGVLELGIQGIAPLDAAFSSKHMDLDRGLARGSGLSLPGELVFGGVGSLGTGLVSRSAFSTIGAHSLDSLKTFVSNMGLAGTAISATEGITNSTHKFESP